MKKHFSRREVLGGASTALLAGGVALAGQRLLGSSGGDGGAVGTRSPTTPIGASSSSRSGGSQGVDVLSGTTPAVFISHGSPMVALEDDEYTEALAAFGSTNRPAAVAVISAHWEAPGPIRITSQESPNLIYDFGGFPQALYQVRYPSPGAPLVAAEIAERLNTAGHQSVLDPARGLDHGVWVPLLRLWADAGVPTVAISLTQPRSPEQLWKLGEALAPLRKQGVMLLGSGGIVHNLRLLERNKRGPTIDWAREFDEWIAEKMEQHPSKIIGYRSDAPNARAAVPTTEHFDPLFAILGASAGDKQESIFNGFHHGSLSMRSFALLDS